MAALHQHANLQDIGDHSLDIGNITSIYTEGINSDSEDHQV